MTQTVKNPIWEVGLRFKTWVWEDALKSDMATHSSTLVSNWKDRGGLGGSQSMGQRAGTGLGSWTTYNTVFNVSFSQIVIHCII